MSKVKQVALAIVTHVSTFISFWLQMLGPLLILVATVLISFIIYTYFAHLLPALGSGFGRYVHLLIAFTLIFNIAFNYYSVVTTPPGYPPDLEEDQISAPDLAALRRAPAPKKGEGWSRWCKRCDNLKPERAHHCHVCDTCVLRMDHHCPWVGNCVGYANHRYFYLFCAWLWLGCAYVALLSSKPFFQLTPGVRTHYFVHLAFLLTISVLFSLSLLTGWHTYLILSGQTTIEVMHNRLQANEAKRRGDHYRNPFDLGYSKNWSLFFGIRHWWLFLLPSPPTGGTGLTYPKWNDE